VVIEDNKAPELQAKKRRFQPCEACLSWASRYALANWPEGRGHAHLMKTTFFAILAALLFPIVGRAAIMENQGLSADELAQLLGVEVVKKSIQTEPGHRLEVWIEKRENGKKSIPWSISQPGDSWVYSISLLYRADGTKRSIAIAVNRTDARGTVRGDGTPLYEFSVPQANTAMFVSSQRATRTEEVEDGKEYQIFQKTEQMGTFKVEHFVKIKLTAVRANDSAARP
jgi:hypothetical protein